MFKFIKEAYKISFIFTVFTTSCVVGFHAGNHLWKKVLKKVDNENFIFGIK